MIAPICAKASDDVQTGVLASVATLITCAAPETGFQGIGPTKRFARKDLLSFDSDIEGTLAMRRDNGKGVVVDIDTDHVPHEPIMSQFMPKAVAGKATPAEQAEFAKLWHDRVRRMLIDHADNPKLIRLYDWN